MNTENIKGCWLLHLRDESDYQKYADMTGISVQQLKTGGARIVDTIIDIASGYRYLAIAVPVLPRELISKRTALFWLKEIKQFIEALELDKPVIGLGLWWGGACLRGNRNLAQEVFEEYSVCDGYRGTVEAIVNQVKEGAYTKDNIAIIGMGNVGSMLYGTLLNIRYFKIDCYDKHDIAIFRKKYDKYNVVITCTSSTDYVITPELVTPETVYIDDSWPKACCPEANAIDGAITVLPHIVSRWLVEDGKVFGCLWDLIRAVMEKE